MPAPSTASDSSPVTHMTRKVSGMNTERLLLTGGTTSGARPRQLRHRTCSVEQDGWCWVAVTLRLREASGARLFEPTLSLRPVVPIIVLSAIGGPYRLGCFGTPFLSGCDSSQAERALAACRSYTASTLKTMVRAMTDCLDEGTPRS